MSARDSEKKLRARIAGGILQLSGDDADSAELSFLLPGAFGSDTLAVEGPVLAVSGEALTLSGRVRVLGVDRVSLVLTIDYSGPRLTLTLATSAPVISVPDLGVALDRLSFFKAHDGPWGASGAIRLRLYEVDLTLQAFFEQDGSTQRVRFRQQLDSPPAMLALAPIGSIALSAVELRRTESTAGVRWQYAADAAIALSAIPTFALALYGTATFPPDGVDAGLDFVAASDDVRNRITQEFPVAALQPPPAVSFTAGRGCLARSGAAPDQKWSLSLAAVTEFTGMPSFLTDPIPGSAGLASVLPSTPRAWTLDVSPGSVALTVDRLQDNPLQVQLPSLPRDGGGLPLGTLWLDATNWGIVFGDAPELTVSFHIAASSEVNRLFGTRPDGLTPTLEFFRTYGPGEDPASKATGLVLTIDRKGVLARLTSSPIEWLQYDDPWWLLTLGNAAAGENYGKLRFASPRFSYDGRRFSVTGAYEILEPLKLPLAPVKAVLRAAQLAPVADALPDGLPIERVDLATPDGKLNAAGFMTLVAKAGADARLQEALQQAISAIDGVLARTPEAFSRFLSIGPPQRLDYDIAIAPGGVQLDVRTGPDDDPARQPIRALLPFADPVFGPELMGIELYGVSFGAMLSGAVGVLRLDARLERFDLATLLLCQLSGGNCLDGEPVSTVHRRYVFDKLLALIPTTAPIPVPLFYQSLGISYRGWDGIEFETAWSLPEPQLGFLEAVDLVRAAFQFASRRDFLFDPAAPAPGGLDLPFGVGPNYIRLPAWLGGGLLGDDQGSQGRLWSAIANFLDGCKTGEAHYFLDAVPLSVRVGAPTGRFGPFALTGAYALTTPRELAGHEGEPVRQLLAAQLARDPDTRMLDLLPAASASDAGMVMLLQAGFEITGLLRLEGGFAFAAIGGAAQDASGQPLPRGVAAVLRFEGAAGPLGLLIEGALGAGADGVWVELHSSPITWNGASLLSVRGHLAIGTDGFRIGAGFGLGTQCDVDGELLIGNGRLALSGTLSWAYAGDRTLQGSATVRFAADAVTASCTGALYGAAVSLAATRDDAGGRATVALDLPDSLQKSFTDDLKGIAATAQDAIARAKADMDQKVSDYEIELSLNGLRQALPGICHAALQAIDSGINSGFSKWPKLWLTRIDVPGKGPALSAARNQAQPYKDAMNALAAACDPNKADDDAFRNALTTALGAVLAHQHLTIKVAVLGTICNRDLYDGSMRAKLVAAQGMVALLPEKSSLKVSAQAVYRDTLAAFGTAAAIGQDIASGVAANMPVIESVAFTAPFGALASVIDGVEARVRHKGATKTVQVTVDLADLPGTVSHIAAAFAA